MTKILRKLQKLFASSGTLAGQFGSGQTGAKLKSTDLDTLQALSAWLNGWTDAVISGEKLPPLEEMDCMGYIFSQQIAYILQEGIPEYLSTKEYHQNSIVKKTGTNELYSSLITPNLGNALPVQVSDVNWQFLGDLGGISTTIQGLGLIKKQISISNNVADSNNDIDFSAGNFDFDDDSGQEVISALIKRLDATWTVGTNQGGLDTGSKAIDTFYYCFAIHNPTTKISDFLYSTSVSSPTLPSGYTKKKRVGSILTDGSGNILAFTQIGRWFEYNERILSLSDTTPAGTKTPVPLAIPLVDCNVRISVLGRDISSAFINIFGENGVDSAPSQDDCDIAVEPVNQAASELQRLTSDGSISYRSSNTAMDAFKIWTRAYEDINL